ncbi:MAG: RNA polymerase sigma-70 factor (ECF subfamily) [Mariniblastus sp.]
MAGFLELEKQIAKPNRQAKSPSTREPIRNGYVTQMNMSKANQEDQLLIRQTIDGQKEAFDQLIRKYQDRLFNGMVQILRSEPEAEDVVQDAFVLAFTKLHSFKGNSAFFTWLYRIAYNVAITRLRRRKPTVPLDGTGEAGKLDFPDGGPSPDDRLQKDEQAAQLHNALARLSDEHRVILVLREMDDLDYDAISDVLGLPIGTVRSRLHRARVHLREHLDAIMNNS